jgi:hypothetical protein
VGWNKSEGWAAGAMSACSAGPVASPMTGTCAARRSSCIVPLVGLSVLAAASCLYSFDFPVGVCSSDVSCLSGQYCAYPDKLCGSGLPGRCESVEEACAKLPVGPSGAIGTFASFCGCDGKTVPDTVACAQLLRQNVDLSVDQRTCPAANGLFRCGYLMCKKGKQACVQTVGAPDSGTYQCVAYYGPTCPEATGCNCVDMPGFDTIGCECNSIGSELFFKCPLTDGGGGSDADAAPGICSPDLACPSGQYCDYADKLCGNGSRKGRCASVDEACTQLKGGSVDSSYCGCNGKPVGVDDVCDLLLKQNIDLSVDTRHCSAADGLFRCGYAMCRTGQDACVKTVGTTDSITEQCVAISVSGCGATVDCTCKMPEFDGTSCTCHSTNPGDLVFECSLPDSGGGSDGTPPDLDGNVPDL